jgi:hypothetical protein
MITKNYFIAGIVCLFAVANASAQTPSTAGDPEPIEGSPYLDDAFVPARVFHDNTVSKMNVRYNLAHDVMEYQQGGTSLGLEPKPNIKKVVIGDQVFRVEKYEAKGKTSYGYFALLDSGKVSLFARRGVTLIAAKPGGGFDGSNTPARYVRAADVFYYKIGDGDLQQVDNIKSLIASFPDRQEDLTAYAKKEKVSARKEKTLVQFVQYYNTH